MSGVEVAGLVLGAVPILIEVIDRYRSGIKRVRLGFKKRKAIEELGRDLRFLKVTIEMVTRNVLIRCGCETAAEAKDAQLISLLQDQPTRDMVNTFLGVEIAQVFSDALHDCMASISHATAGLASLVPELARVKDNVDVQAVLDANAVSKKARIQPWARFSMVFGLGDLKNEIEALRHSVTLLNMFEQNVTATHQPVPIAPSRKAEKLAKALQIVRQNAVNLHSALTRQWITPCHQRHELKVFLEDRTTEPKLKQATDAAGGSCFQVVFVGGTTHPTDVWHETLFHIEGEDPQTTGTSLPSRGPSIQISVAQPQPAQPRQNVQDICGAITDAAYTAHHPIFYLDGTKDIAMSLDTQAPAGSQSCHSSSATLERILQDHHSRNLPPLALPWKSRMVLALKVASSFLQFVQTPWAQPSWSASNIHIPYSATASNQKFDLDRPFLSADFSGNCSQVANRSTQVKEDLLELGVLLLEIWHETNIDTKFTQLSTNNTTYMRRACALEWLDDPQNSLMGPYYHAASICVSGHPIPDPRASEWNDSDIRKSVCENVIDRLTKLAHM